MVISAGTFEAACTECGAGEDVERAAHSWAEAVSSLAAAGRGGQGRRGHGGAAGGHHKVLTAARAAGFAVRQHVFTEVASPTVMAAAGMTAYLAEAEGTAVATGTAAVFQDCVGLFNISTLPLFRGRGYARVM